MMCDALCFLVAPPTLLITTHTHHTPPLPRCGQCRSLMNWKHSSGAPMVGAWDTCPLRDPWTCHWHCAPWSSQHNARTRCTTMERGNTLHGASGWCICRCVVGGRSRWFVSQRGHGTQHGAYTITRSHGLTQAGAGIVADSVPEAEYEETVNKAAALGRAIDLAEQAFVQGQ